MRLRWTSEAWKDYLQNLPELTSTHNDAIITALAEEMATITNPANADRVYHNWLALRRVCRHSAQRKHLSWWGEKSLPCGDKYPILGPFTANRPPFEHIS